MREQEYVKRRNKRREMAMEKMLRCTGEVLGLVVLGLLAFGQVVQGDEVKNLLKNPGFEEIKPYTVSEKWKGKIEATEMPKEWGINPSYPGKLTVIYDAITSHGGSKYIKLEKPEEARKNMALMSVGKNWQIPVSPEKRYLIKVWAKGEGIIGISVYGYSKPRGGKFIPGFGSRAMKVANPDKWQEYKFEFSTKPKPDIKSITVAFSIKGTVYLDDAYFAPLAEEEKTE